ncbi:pyruvate dehydrogenase phosphatase regulatory subunit, mitochondrial-like [Uloborus diversus]|uniref:pyruvate dehydrogenase phosphatase regulatory subunit, mitochondrial-like n=1 Tax=Uloborus diversus TaxID=327109 RepID=UPI00240A84EA|nr:pyruvate dehydrogenase phosphatase regulatory subunit, mitochondrial-like [Uloborus diversus]
MKTISSLGLLKHSVHCVKSPIKSLFKSNSSWQALEEKFYNDFCSQEIPKQAQVVICGGGLVGNSVAYHLARDFEWKDVVILEQSRLGGGTIKFGAGLLGQIKPTTIETKLCQYSIELYKALGKKGLSTGWKECGSLSLARTTDRMTYFRHIAASAVARNIECQILSPKEAREKCPIISTEMLKGALWIPGDGSGDPFDATLTFASEAAGLGVKFVENCSVQRVITDDKHQVKGVETNKGLITCEYFVNSGGHWANHIGRMSYPRVKVPLYPCEHQYLQTMPVEGIDPMLPVIRDYDGHFYVREKNGGYLAGGFEPVSKPLDVKETESPSTFKPLPEDWDQFHTLLEQMLFRIPSLGQVEVDCLNNGPESFSPDCKLLVGEAPEVKNYFVATGMKATGMEAAGGVGKITADWIVNGEPKMDLWDVDIRRFLGLHNNRLFLRDRMVEVPGMHYKVKYPNMEFSTGRNIRMSPIYPRLKAAGAVFSQSMGYERPCYFRTDLVDKEGIENEVEVEKPTFFKPSWFDYLESEYMACRRKVALLDYSSFTKLEVWSPGREALDLLQYLCSNNVDIPKNAMVHTGMQNKHGGYENDCSVARMDYNRFMIIAPTIQQTRCQSWIKRNLPPESPVLLTDITSLYTAICLMGPLAQSLLSDITDSSVSYKEFHFFTCKELNIGLANNIKTFHQTHTGELGYVLYIPNEYALHVYDELMEKGKKYGIQHAGYYAPRALRIEKFFAFWAQDLDTTTTPFECGRVYRVNFEKNDFMGKEALMKQKQEGIKRRYIQLVLEDHDIEQDIWPWGSEPIYVNGKFAGLTTNAGYGFTLKKMICLGYIKNIDENGEPQVITNDFILKSSFEVDICGRKFPAKVNIHSPNLSQGFEYVIDSNGYIATQFSS